jgi:uncharacterized coiled-coil protein SlyX
MKTRSQKAQRILSVLKQLHTIEEFKKLQLQRRLSELESSQHEVIHALNTDDALHGLFIDQTAKFLQSLAKEADKVGRAKDEQSKRLLENASKMKQAERLKDALVIVERRAQNETELADIIEQHATKTNASPR